MSRPAAVLLSQGDEVLTGQTVDTNAAWLAERLTDIGFDVVRHFSVGDRLDDLVAVTRESLSLGDVVICTGGLGPTQDDLTSEAAAAVLGCELALDEAELAHIHGLHRAFKMKMAPSNEKQAWLPSAATPMRNDWGTAPGFRLEHTDAVGYFVPGVPREMRSFWEHRIRPDLIERFHLHPERLTVLRCLGIHESRLATILAPFEALEGVTLGFRTKLPENQVKLRFHPDMSLEDQQAVVDRAHAAIGKSVFGIDTGPVEAVIRDLLDERGQTVSTAESCTGGGIAAALTSVPGSSRVFVEGACVYANEAKTRTCQVDPELLEEVGAVSESVARQLALGMQARTGTTYAIGTTGIAGPGGGSLEKPVGTVHVALAGPRGVHHRKLSLRGDRERIIRLTIGSALDTLRRELQGLLPPP
ncbi:MAG: CinA family nicotinamide mononucleotide deamidase-related protein [Proteobacteria bacterium]|nr:CinA family nicotinamide mononucleotide deamidase-related protein [Pseudomonadota bacterium]